MTKLSLIAAGLAILFSLQVAANPICEWKDPMSGNSFDYSSLQRSEGWKVKDTSGGAQGLFTMVYLFNFCGGFPTKCKDRTFGASESLEVLGQPTESCEVIGDINQQQVTTLDPNDASKGLKITYTGGDICQVSENPMENGTPRKINFKVMCASSPDETWMMTPISPANSKCNLEFIIKSPAGCPGSMFHLGGWSSMKLLVYLMLAFGAYAIAGMAYNRKVNGLVGVEGFPHIEFWRETPAMVLEGVRFSLATLKNLSNRISGYLGGAGGGSSASNHSPRGYVTI